MNDNKLNLILASLAKVAAERDEVNYKIGVVLNNSSNTNEINNSVNYLTKLFKKRVLLELTMEAIQIFHENTKNEQEK